MASRHLSLTLLTAISGCAQGALTGDPGPFELDETESGAMAPDANLDAGSVSLGDAALDGSAADVDAADAAQHAVSDAAGSVPDATSSVPDANTAVPDASRDASGDATGIDAGCADGDGDGTDDCKELADGDDWTDPAIFNGVKVRWREQCSTLGACSENNSRSKVDACMAGSAREELNQHAGWDWDDPPDSICHADYGFRPNWSECGSSWQARWTGFINLKIAGRHCFAIAGATNEGCGAVFFDQDSVPAQSGGAARCYQAQPGVYPIMWHYTMDNGSGSSLHLRYCHGATADCVPSAALPASMLRVSRP